MTIRPFLEAFWSGFGWVLAYSVQFWPKRPQKVEIFIFTILTLFGQKLYAVIAHCPVASPDSANALSLARSQGNGRSQRTVFDQKVSKMVKMKISTFWSKLYAVSQNPAKNPAKKPQK